MAELQRTQLPVLHVTRYDLVSSFLIAIVLALGASVVCLALWWATIRVKPQQKSIPVEIVEFPGGVEDGAIDETLRLDSAEPEAQDASLAEVPAEQNEIQESLDNMVEIATEATNLTDKQFATDTRNAGKAGSAKGTGRRALGKGPGVAGMPREQRWFISFADQQTLEEYARQLDFFGVELGVLEGGRLAYLSNLSARPPQVRYGNNGTDEQRLYMIWQGGGRRKADLELFGRAGIQVGGSQIFQFYPPETEQKLARLELDYRNRKMQEIRRTYFVVQRVDKGYGFQVTQQTYFR